MVKELSKEMGVGNPFDVIKLDNTKRLPDILINNDYAVIHLGNGYHQFIKKIDTVYHCFEDVQKTVDWHYKKPFKRL